MSSHVSVLFIGPGTGALDLTAELGGFERLDATVVSTPPTDIDAVLDDDRLDCAVCGTGVTGPKLARLRERRPDLSLVGFGCEGAGDLTASVDPADGMGALATTLADLLGEDESVHGDSTPRAALQEEFGESRERLSRILERMEDAVFAVDADWRFTYLNERAEAVMEVDADAVLGESLWEVFPGAVDSTFDRKYRDAMNRQEPTTFEEFYDPLETWFEVRADPSEDGLLVYFRDITERKEREQELKRLTRAIDEAPIGISMTDPTRADNPLVYANEAFADLTGYEESTLLGRNCRLLQGADTDPETVGELRDAIDAGEPVATEILNYRNDGTPFWNQLDIAPVRDDEGELLNFVGFQRDVTADRRLEHRLRELHETARELMLAEDEADIGRLAVDAASEILDLPLTTLWRYSEADGTFVAAAQTETADEQFDLSTVPAATAADDSSSATATPGWIAFETGELQVIDELDEAVAETLPLPVRSAIVAPLGEYGVLATAGMEPHEFDTRDVDLFRILATTTEEALDRARREQERQRQNERLDEFVSVVSHDLRNPLQVAMTRLETYQETGDDGHLDFVASNHRRMATLIEDLLQLARQGETVRDPDHVTLSTVANQAWTTVDTAGATLEMTTAATLVADPHRLQQLFENLFRNAIEHAGPDVTITVDILGSESDESGFFVADDGPGIPESDRDVVFDHGYSTADRGNGLGLSIVKRIAAAHGWGVRVSRGADGGARFEFTAIPSLTSTG